MWILRLVCASVYALSFASKVRFTQVEAQITLQIFYKYLNYIYITDILQVFELYLLNLSPCHAEYFNAQMYCTLPLYLVTLHHSSKHVP